LNKLQPDNNRVIKTNNFEVSTSVSLEIQKQLIPKVEEIIYTKLEEIKINSNKSNHTSIDFTNNKSTIYVN
jgi:hypothetical protein